MEQQERLFPVQIAYSAYECMAVCTVTIEGTTSDDLVGATNRSVGRPEQSGQQTGIKAIPGNPEDRLNAFMRVLEETWLQFWRPARYADFHQESSSHVLLVSLLENESLHLEVERAGRTLACAIVVYEGGAFRLVEASCKGVSVSFEKGPRDPVLAFALDVLIPGVAPKMATDSWMASLHQR